MEQNSEKQYILTELGGRALDLLFQEGKKTPSDSFTATKGEIQYRVGPTSLRRTSSVIMKVLDLPSQIYWVSVISYFPLAFVLIILAPRVVFLHFVPLEINEYWSGMIPALWIISLCSLLYALIYLSSGKQKLASWGLLFSYIDFHATVGILSHFFPGLTQSPLLELLSILLQVSFLFVWTVVLGVQYLSWERAVISALIINYLLLLL